MVSGDRQWGQSAELVAQIFFRNTLRDMCPVRSCVTMLVVQRGRLARSLERVRLGRLGAMWASFAVHGESCHMWAQAGAMDLWCVALRAAMLAGNGFCRIEGREVGVTGLPEVVALASRSVLPLIAEWPGTHSKCMRR